MKIGILGAGAWGLALSMIASQKADQVIILTRSENNDLTQRLSGFKQQPNMSITSDKTMIRDVDFVLSVVPTQALRQYLTDLSGFLSEKPLILCSKGIEQSTGLFISEIVKEVTPQVIPAILSGPSFAEDVVNGLPTAVTLASAHEGTARILAQSLITPTFRLYHSTDVRGVEIGSAAKNVLAIAAGIVAGRGLGASALSALIARGFAELSRFGEAFSANPATLTGLSGLGDLVLTCTSPQSRNFSLGLSLAKGEKPSGKLAEGAFTASILVDMAKQKGIDMPISRNIDLVLKGELEIDEAILALMTRPQKGE